MNSSCVWRGLMVAACVLFIGSAGADTYYVDATHGNDAWDGSTDYAHRDEANKIGPKETLVEVLKGTKSGDVVYAAAGRYAKGSYDVYDSKTGALTSRYRARVPTGVLLKGAGANKTFIVGEADPLATATSGCSTQSVTCVRLVYSTGASRGAAIQGFTITGGRATGNPSSTTTGGGVSGESYYCTVADCYFTDNKSNYRGGALGGSCPICIRCRFGAGNSGASNTGVAYDPNDFVDCIFEKDSGNFYRSSGSCKFVNCTIDCNLRTYGTFYFYNCVLGENAGTQESRTYINCLLTAAQTSGTFNECDVVDSAADLKLGVQYQPQSGSPAIDAVTNDYYTTKMPVVSGWRTELCTGTDIFGNPRQVGERMDYGAGEYNPDTRYLKITDAQTGLTVTGADKGYTAICSAGDSVTFTLARNYSTEIRCAGITVNGTFYPFTGTTADLTYEYTIAYGDATGDLTIEAVYPEHNDWYVDASATDDSGSGYTPYQAKRTLQGIFTNACVVKGDTVHAAPGVYKEGSMPSAVGSLYTNRVVVTAGVTLVADKGKDVTAIEGYIPPKESRWTTTDPIRCVMLESGAIIRGFTVRNGMAALDQTSTGTFYSGCGGGINGGTAIDCVVSNCYAVRGGGVQSSTLIRCRVVGNYVYNGKNPAGGSSSATAAGMQNGLAYDCYISDQAMNLTEARNCYFSHIMRNGSGSTSVFNCYVGTHSHLKAYTCVFSGTLSDTSTAMDDYIVQNQTLSFDANLRPVKTHAATAEYAIDKGNPSYYAYPKAFVSELGKDLAGGQRVYNGTLDIGPGEYDWRTDYAADINALDGAVEVTEASKGVYETDAKKVAIPTAESLTLVLAPPVGKTTESVTTRLTAEVTGSATFTVTRAGESEPCVTATAADGKKTWTFTTSGEQTLTFAVTGTDGEAVVDSLWSGQLVTILEPTEGLVFTGAAAGQQYVAEGDVITIARDFTLPRLPVSICVNGKVYTFEGEMAEKTCSITVSEAMGAVTVSNRVLATKSIWYVDEKNGNDANDGRQSYAPVQSLQAVMTNALLVGKSASDHDDVHVAAGVYTNGCYESTNASGTVLARFRVKIPEWVVVIGAGRDKTFIKGAPDPTTKGAGPLAMRGVYMGTRSILKGVTVCGGYWLKSNDWGNIGGGVEYGTIIDCVVSNCVAYRGGATYRTQIVNSLITGCSASSACGGCYDTTFVLNSSMYGDGMSVYTPDNTLTIYNSSFGVSHPYANSNKMTIKNSVIRAGAYKYVTGNVTNLVSSYYNCRLTGSLANAEYVDAATKQATSAELNQAGDFTPLKGSVLIDAGDPALYEEGVTAFTNAYPWTAAYLDADREAKSQQRVYNGTVDIGGIEYDWRADYAQDIAKGRLTVAEATAGAWETTDAAVRLSGGDSLTLGWAEGRVPRARLFRFTVSEGTLTVKLNGETVQTLTADGEWSYTSPAASDVITISFAGEAGAYADILRTKSATSFLYIVK